MSTHEYQNLCPVPFEQQPLNEYTALKKSMLFAWSTKTINNFIIKLLIVFASFMFVELSIYLIIIYIKHTLLQVSILVHMIIIPILTIEFLLIRLYLGWSYILKRLLSAVVFYEESGWYDGQLWIKPADILIQDRLIGIYQVGPILEKIKVIFFINSFFLSWEFIYT
uniref:Ycf36 n=1 Tax=Kumanoa americana TaxID=1196377 RepID=A0A1C9CGE0_9FLOR|nr:hypothetical protein Kuma_019 [Kumanoa americana]AOM67453.1 hypothetical protein Kuma_019 [Kumanoa americana]